MKKLLFFTFLIYTFALSQASDERYCLIFFYIGNNTLPSYLDVSIANARLFNTICPIILLTNSESIRKSPSILNSIQKHNVTVINCDELEKSKPHVLFDDICKKRNLQGYWKYTTERFFYIAEAMDQYQLHNLFQIECDVMLYVNLTNYLNIFFEKETKIASPFQNDYLASVSFTYFANAEAIKRFIQWIPQAIDCQCPESDMYLLASYKNHTSQEVDHLPTLSKDVIRRNIVSNLRNEVSSTPWKYWNNTEQWDSIFDNDGIGTYLETNKWTFNQAYFHPNWYGRIEWELDSLNRKIPFIRVQSYKYRINTLHIASKQLHKYSSYPTKKLSYQSSNNPTSPFPSKRLLGYICNES